MRLKKYDYSQSGWYFVTICTKERGEVFGRVKNEVFVPNDCGLIVKKCWEEIPKHFINVFLDEYVIMPEHFHGILIIKNKHAVGDADLRPLRNNVTKGTHRTHMLLPKIIHGFKSSVSRNIHNIRYELIWQRSYYEHVIRNEKVY